MHHHLNFQIGVLVLQFSHHATLSKFLFSLVIIPLNSVWNSHGQRKVYLSRSAYISNPRGRILHGGSKWSCKWEGLINWARSQTHNCGQWLWIKRNVRVLLPAKIARKREENEWRQWSILMKRTRWLWVFKSNRRLLYLLELNGKELVLRIFWKGEGKVIWIMNSGGGSSFLPSSHQWLACNKHWRDWKYCREEVSSNVSIRGD